MMDGMKNLPVLMEDQHRMVADFGHAVPAHGGKVTEFRKKGPRHHSKEWKWEPEMNGDFDDDGNYVPSFIERIHLPLTKDISHKKVHRLARAHRNSGNVRALMKGHRNG